MEEKNRKFEFKICNIDEANQLSMDDWVSQGVNTDSGLFYFKKRQRGQKE